MRLLPLLLLLSACGSATAGPGGGKDARIAVVGSSTVYPFTAAIAERFAAGGARAVPVIESTGTGAGIHLLCGGAGGRPDIAGASRRMRAAEYRRCLADGAGPIVEVPIGLDGLAFVSARGGPAMRLSSETLYRALAASPYGRPNGARTWADVDPSLPATPIRVYGPPPTSGTRDALAELILARGCAAADPAAAALPPAAAHDRCTRIREDGAYVDAGESDNLIVQKLVADPGAIGVLGTAYLEQNADTVAGIPLGGVAPTAAAIADGRYPGARRLYLYVRRDRIDADLDAFLRLYWAAAAPGGPLARRGLVASPRSERAAAARAIAGRLPLDPRSLT